MVTIFIPCSNICFIRGYKIACLLAMFDIQYHKIDWTFNILLKIDSESIFNKILNVKHG